MQLLVARDVMRDVASLDMPS